jgi:CRISPR-associated protein Cas5 subtype I-B
MKALLAEISFFEALFKVHHTKGFRLTYPIPLPTSVAGMFGAILGIERHRIKEDFTNFLFGAAIVKHNGFVIENETFIQYKIPQAQKGVVRTQLMNQPTYLIAMGGPTEKIEEYYAFLMNHNMIYLPYGGQNDFFLENIRIKPIAELVQSNLIANYSPQDLVSEIESKETVMNILPVMQSESNNPNFYFLFSGRLKLKKPVFVVKEALIALYPLEMFIFVQG